MDDQGNVPGGMDNIVMLLATNISTQSSYGWSIKLGTVTIKFTVPASKLSGASADTKYYIVHYDGSGYQIIPVNVVTTNSSTTIEAHVSDLSGTYTAVMSIPPKPAAAPSPTPAPTPAPTPVPCPTPGPASGILGFLPSLWASAFGTFAIGEAAGAFILIVLGRFMR
jgi:hypothetical protein